MVALKIPASPEELTAAWLTEALRSGGALNDTAVASFDTEIIGVGVGFLGKLARLTLRYEGDAGGAPRTLIAKFPTLDPEARQVAMLFRFYEREVRFYEQIAGRVQMRVPRPYYIALDAPTGDFVLLLEDLAPARCGDQLDSCIAEQARLAVHDLAAFHAAWWENPELDALTWMPRINDPVQLAAEEAYQQAWPAFREHFGGQLPRSLASAGERLGTNVIAILNTMADRPCTIVHGDYRLDNLFFGSPQGGEPLAVIDWQISTRGIGTFDLAYFMTGNVATETRRALEKDVLRMYHDTLREGGVQDYDFDEFMRDYRLSALFCLVYNVIGIGSLDFGNERGLELFKVWTERTAAAIDDLNAAELMPA